LSLDKQLRLGCSNHTAKNVKVNIFQQIDLKNMLKRRWIVCRMIDNPTCPLPKKAKPPGANRRQTLERAHTERASFGMASPILASPEVTSNPETQRFLHILHGNGPDWVYQCCGQFDLLCALAPPPELLLALQRQSERGTVPPATAAWLKLWQELEVAK
jgi:hypothetical protein